MAPLEGEQLPRPVDSRGQPVPDAQEGRHQVVVPRLGRVEGLQRIPSSGGQPGAVEHHAGGHQREPEDVWTQRVARRQSGRERPPPGPRVAGARRRPRPAGDEGLPSIAVRRAILTRAVEVEDQRGQGQHEARAASGADERAENADPHPAPVAGAPEEAHGKHQEQRLRVDRREEERHRREGGHQHRESGHVRRLRPDRDEPPGACRLERRQSVDAVEGQRERGERDQHACEHERRTEPPHRPYGQRIEREVGGPGRGVGRQVGAIAEASDDEVPGRVPTRDGCRQKVAQPSEPPCDPGWVEGRVRIPQAECRDASQARCEDEQARGPQRAPAIAGRPHARGIGPDAPKPRGGAPGPRVSGRGMLRMGRPARLGCPRWPARRSRNSWRLTPSVEIAAM